MKTKTRQIMLIPICMCLKIAHIKTYPVARAMHLADCTGSQLLVVMSNPAVERRAQRPATQPAVRAILTYSSRHRAQRQSIKRHRQSWMQTTRMKVLLLTHIQLTHIQLISCWMIRARQRMTKTEMIQTIHDMSQSPNGTPAGHIQSVDPGGRQCIAARHT
jgi:hypothetical protein